MAFGRCLRRGEMCNGHERRARLFPAVATGEAFMDITFKPSLEECKEGEESIP